MIAALWAAAASLATPALRAMLRRRAVRGKEIAARLPEREGIDPTPRPPGRLVWLHAASMGETQSVLPVIEALHASGAGVLVTTGTVTSAAMLAHRMPAVLHRFVPLDVPRWAARFLDHWRPDAAAFVESELWPNLLAACRRRGIPLLLVNARMSARSLRAWRRVPGFAAGLMQGFARIHPQSAGDADRFRTLGATRLVAPGNLKLAAPPLPHDAAELARLRTIIGDSPVWLAASTHPGEEAIAAEAHRTLLPRHPGLVTIVAPRHAPRGPALARELSASRRAAGADPAPGSLWLADTMGELGLLYRLAPIVFVGRSLVGQGGQNPLEPARLGCALAAGPHVANFAEPVAQLAACGALTTVADAAGLARWVGAMLADPAGRARAGAAAQGVATGAPGLPGQVAAMILAEVPRR